MGKISKGRMQWREHEGVAHR